MPRNTNERQSRFNKHLNKQRKKNKRQKRKHQPKETYQDDEWKK